MAVAVELQRNVNLVKDGRPEEVFERVEMLIDAFGKNFISRRDVVAHQRPDGYYPSKASWTRDMLRKHIMGHTSLGHYLLDENNKCKLFAFDIDLVKDARPDPDDPEKELEFIDPDGVARPGSPRRVFSHGDPSLSSHMVRELRIVAGGLAARAARVFGVRTAISFSGSKGLHVYGFTGHEDAALVRSVALEVIKGFGVYSPRRGNNFFKHDYLFPNVEIEVFPKQDRLEPGAFGNLMRLPLGAHCGSDAGMRSYFIDPFAPDDMLVEVDPLSAITVGIDWDAEV